MYKLPILYCKTKEWYVYYSYLNPETGKFERFKVKKGLNSPGRSNAERREIAKALVVTLTRHLERGFNPFQEFIQDEGPDKNLHSLIALYLAHKEQTVRHKTFLQHRQILTKFMRFMDSKIEISGVTKAHVTAFLATGSGWSGKTYNHHLLTLKTFFHYYLTQYDDYLTKNPCLGLSARTTTAVGNVPISDSDMQAAKSYLQSKYPIVWTFCLTIYYAALRPHTEARLLQRKHLNFEAATITVPGYLSKNRLTQTIPFDRKLMAVLEHMRDQTAEWYVFGGESPLSDDHFMMRFARMKKAVGIGKDVSMYSFKHLRAIHLYQDTLDVEFIRKLFRHSSALTTQIYLRNLGLMTDASNLVRSRDL